MRPIEFIATIANGIIKPPMNLHHFLSANEGKQVRIVLSWSLKKRSIKQNAFWFGPVIQCVRDWLRDQGYNLDANETHEYLIRHVWKYTDVMMIEGVPFERRLSSTKLSTGEWERMIEITRQWAAERGFILPMPNEDSIKGEP
jgi:hypothetical protein